MTSKKARPPRTALLLAGLLAIAGCRPGSPGSADGAKPPEMAVPVVAGSVARKDVPLEITSFGRVEPFSTIAVKTQVAGEIIEVLFREGDEVKRGQQILTIDPRPYESAIRRAEAALARDEAGLKNAELEVKRFEKLTAQNVTSQEEYDRAIASVEALRATVRADAAAIESARVERSYCTIFSPIDGRAGKILLHRGNIVKANADTPIIEIVGVRPVHVSFAVPEDHLSEIRRRMAEAPLAVTAVVPAEGGRPVEGRLTLIENSVDGTTGTIRLRATYDNGDGFLWPGQFVDVRLRLSTLPGALVLPSHAVGIGQKGNFVFVVKEAPSAGGRPPEARAELRPVTVGTTYREETVIEGGLQEGETVVLEGQLRLVPGALVSPKAAGSEAAGTGVARP